MTAKEIGKFFRQKFGNSIPEMAAQAKDCFSDVTQRRRGADSQESALIDVLRKAFPKVDPERFLSPKEACVWARVKPSNKDASIENAYCGDVLILNKDKSEISIGIDVKMSSKSSDPKYFGTIQFSSILDFNNFNPPKISKKLLPKYRLFMCFRTSGEYGFVDPKEALDSLLSKKAKLIASKTRIPSDYPRDFLDEVASYVDKIEVIRGDGELWPQDHIYYEYQDKLMF